VVIDEFKSWQDLHPPGSQGVCRGRACTGRP
jgi:hypothetical protein